MKNKTEDMQGNELEGLIAEKEQLVRIEAKLRDLEAAATDARAAVETASAFLTEMTSESGILRFTDSQIDKQAKMVRDAQRKAAQAALDLTKYHEGEAKNISGRLTQNARERFLAEHAAARAEFFEKLRQYLRLGAEIAALESAFPRLAREAGFNRPPIGLFTSPDGAASDFDLVQRDIAEMEPTLLPESDPQRTYVERLHAASHIEVQS